MNVTGAPSIKMHGYIFLCLRTYRSVDTSHKAPAPSFSRTATYLESPELQGSQRLCLGKKS